MATLENINHDAGGVVSTYWTDSVSDAGGRLTVSVAAGLNSTARGLQINYDATNTWEVTEQFVTPSSMMSLSFYMDPNGALTPVVDSAVILVSIGLAVTNSASQRIIGVSISKLSDGTISVSADFNNDSATGGQIGDPFTISDAPHFFEILAIREKTADSGDGVIALYVDGVPRLASLTDNYTLWGTIDTIYAYGEDQEVAMVGTTYYFDEILLTDTAGFSGYDLVVPGT